MQIKNRLDNPFVIAIVSGKGGVGKSIAAINVAETLNRNGYRVALLDSDLGMSNVATMLNEQVAATVANWVNGTCSFEELPHNSEGITFITTADQPGMPGSHIDKITQALDYVVNWCAETHDFIIIDTPAGAGEINLWALDRAHSGLLILVDEPTAISDVYRFCKYILSIDPTYPFVSLVNFAADEKAAKSTHERFNTITQYFLKKQTRFLGFIPESKLIRESVNIQLPVTRLSSDAYLSREFEFISQNIIALALETSDNIDKQSATQQHTAN